MRVLMITQKVDRHDGVLGIYHEWISHLATRVEKLSVIALSLGSHSLPKNVSLFSLGKDKGPRFFRKVRYTIRFWRYLFQLRGTYDVVFVHMNKEYVLLGALIWKFAKIPIIFWYNHPEGDWKVRLASFFADRILHTSPQAFTAYSPKAFRMPVGVSVSEAMQPHLRETPIRAIVVSRISPVKNIHRMLDAAAALGDTVRLSIYGAPVDRSEDKNYYDALMNKARDLPTVSFRDPVPNTEVRELFAAADLSLNLTTTGSMDKTIFESCAVGCPVVTSNQALRAMFPERWQGLLVARENDAHDCAEKIKAIAALSDADYEILRTDLFRWVAEEHSLPVLLDRLCAIFEGRV